jgi:alkylation response protein AidB-like acyl-CoA dehydrogenase
MQVEENALTATRLPSQLVAVATQLEPPQLSLDNLLQQTVEIATFCTQNAAEIDRYGVYPARELESIATAGLLRAPLASKYGGLGLGYETSSIAALLEILKQIGRANLAVGCIYEGHVNGLQLLQTFGTPDQIDKYARDVRDRHKIFGVWNAEARDGVKLVPLGHGKYRLEGTKTFATGCGCVDRPFVGGTMPNGEWQLCIVSMDEVETEIDPDWWQPAGMKAAASYKVDFTGVILDQNELIGQPGDYYRQPWLTAGVVRFAAVQLGGAEALFTAARQFLQTLDRTKDPYQEERFGKMAIGIESGQLWLQSAADRLEHYHPIFAGDPAFTSPRALTLVTYANMVRTAIEQICMETIQLAERSVGTRGLLPSEPIERIVRDLTVYLRQPAFDAALATVGRYALQTAATDALWTNEFITK